METPRAAEQEIATDGVAISNAPGGEEGRSSRLRISTTSLPPAFVGINYYAPLFARGGAAPYHWSVSKGALPGGMSLDSQNGAIKGEPAAEGRFEITITASDTLEQKTASPYIIEVNEPGGAASLDHAGKLSQPLYIATGALPEGGVAESYSVQMEAVGGVPPYSWSLADGNFHRGISLSPARGLISGVPQEKGNRLLLIQVEDADGNRDSAELNLRIDSPPLTILTENLPRGEINKTYEAQLEADGGAVPYRWSLSGGELPAGLFLNASTGLISGTPDGETGQYEFSVIAADREDERAAKTLAISISPTSGFVITDLSAAPSDGKAGLTWMNPVDETYSHTVILRGTGSWPTGTEDGAIVYSGNASDYLDENLENGVAYYYSAIPVMTSGAPGSIGETAKATVTPQAVSLSGPADPFADSVVSFHPLAPGAFGSSALSWALGPPSGEGAVRGSMNVVSLNARANNDGGASPPYGGSITLKFENNIIVNAEGPDFTIFENVFYAGGDPENRFMEPAIVAVSKDGLNFATFPYDFVPHYGDDREINCHNPYCYINADGATRGFAGVNPVYSNGYSPDPRTPSISGGDSFDLSSITSSRFDWIRYVRITATGDNWLIDMNGDKVRHVSDAATGACSGGGSSGFDLDAVCAIHY